MVLDQLVCNEAQQSRLESEARSEGDEHLWEVRLRASVLVARFIGIKFPMRQARHDRRVAKRDRLDLSMREHVRSAEDNASGVFAT